MVDVGTIPLSNGQKLPKLGLGTWLANDESQLKAALCAALDAGYRYIDTATVYKNEHVIGDVLQSYYDAGKLKREDVWITTKLPFFAHEPEVAERLLKESLQKLRTDYIDLYLVHTPLPLKPTPTLDGPATDESGKFIPTETPLIDTWRAMEKFYKNKTVRSIGVSNFNSKQITEILDKGDVKPHNLQVELHVMWPNAELVDFCKKHSITVTSYGSIGSPGRGASPIAKFVEGDCMSLPAVQELAKKYNKTPAQILLRHIWQKDISVIPKSTNADRVRQNIDIFDFAINDEDSKKLDNISPHKRLFVFDFAAHHPFYPFNEPV